jgi:hypothetical protein
VRARILFVFSLLVAGAVSACGGGGGGGGTPATATPSTPTPTSVPTVAANPDGCVGINTATRSTSLRPQAVGVQPPANGDAATYAGTLSETFVAVSPCPIPTTTTSANVTIDVAMTSATNEQDVETDNYATNSTVETTNATVATNSTGSQLSYDETKETTTDSVSDSLVTTYGLQPLTYAFASPLPYPVTSNDPPSTVVDSLADGSSTNRTYNAAADGSYTESDVLTGISPANTIAANSDFSAQYVIQTPLFAGSPNFVSSITLAFSKPVNNIITLTTTFAGGATPPPSTPIEQWWPNTITKPYTDVTTDKGSVTTLPSACAPTNVPGSSEHFQRVITSVDTALGSYDVRTIDTYVGLSYGGNVVAGPACVTINDVEELFYNYFFNTPYFDYISQGGTPFQTDTISEAYWLTSSPATLTRVRAQNASVADVPGLATSIAAHNQGLNFLRATQRTQRMEKFANSLRAANQRKGVIIK